MVFHAKTQRISRKDAKIFTQRRIGVSREDAKIFTQRRKGGHAKTQRFLCKDAKSEPVYDTLDTIFYIRDIEIDKQSQFYILQTYISERLLLMHW